MRHDRKCWGLVVAVAAGIVAWSGAATAQVCPPAPAVCRTAGQSIFMFKNRNNDDKDKLQYRWTQGEATTTAEFQDPTTTTATALCIYAGSAAALIGEQVVPPGPNWQLGKDQKLLYNDASGSADGIWWMLLRSGSSGKARVQLKARGIPVPDLPLPFTDFPLVVQVHQDDGLPCWGSTFTSAATNHFAKIKAKSN